MKRVKSIFKRTLFFSVLVFMGYLGTLYAIQDKLLFYPDRLYISPEKTGFTEFKEHPLPMADGASVMTWYAKGNIDKPAFLFFHGNARQNAAFVRQLDVLVQKGYPVLMMEYRGFGNTRGSLAQETVFKDAVWAFDFLKSQGHRKVIVYGYSFGTAVAMGLTQFRDPDGVVLTAPFASMSQIADEKVPFSSLILKGDYPSQKYVESLKKPLLIVHGKKDTLIPYHHSEALFKAAGGTDKSLVLLDNETHGSVFFGQKNIPLILEWMREKGL